MLPQAMGLKRLSTVPVASQIISWLMINDCIQITYRAYKIRRFRFCDLFHIDYFSNKNGPLVELDPGRPHFFKWP